jgi:hypothetical protein
MDFRETKREIDSIRSGYDVFPGFCGSRNDTSSYTKGR